MRARTIIAGAIGLAGGVGYLLARNASKGPKDQSQKEGKQNDSGRSIEDSAARDQSNTDPETDQFAGNGSRNNVDADSNEGTRSEAQFTANDSHAEAEPLDDRGTDQAEASRMLREIRDGAFEGSDEKLALALGRPADEIEQWTTGTGTIDGDVVLKARALANQRGVNFAT
jgi:hypothetical protein